MGSAIALGKRTFTWSVVVATIAWSMGLSLLVAPLAASAADLTAGTLIKGSLPAVYYYAADGKRYVFPNEKTYKTWYADFSTVTTVTDAELAAVTIGGNATYKPGVQMVKITTDPKVYAVDAGGALRHVATEAVASALYGAGWAASVHDVPDAFFVNYTIGSAVNAAADFDKAAASAAATSIGVDKGIAGAVVAPPAATTVLTASDGGSPGAASVPYLASDAVFAKVKLVGTGTISAFTVTRSGLGADANFSGVKLYDGTTQLGTTQTLNSSHQARFNNLNLAVSGEKVLTIAGDIAATGTATSGHLVQLGVVAASDIELASGSVSGTFPIRGGEMTIANISIGSATLYRGPSMPTSDQNIKPDEVDFLFTEVKISAGGVEALTVKQITAVQAGTATVSDLKDIKLVNSATGETLKSVASLNANSRVIFDGLNINVPKGDYVTLGIKATMTGGSSSSRTIGFELHDGVSYLINVVGNTYGFGITPAANASNDFCATTGVSGNTACQTQTVSTGTLAIARSASSPATGKIAQGGSQVPLLSVDYTVSGEDVNISSQNWDFTFSGILYSELTSVTLYDAAGKVVAGPSDPTSGNTITYTDAMTVPVGTHTYTLKGNIASATSASDTIIPVLDVSEFTVKGSQSGKATTVNTTTDITGNTLTVQAGSLSSVTGATPIVGNVVAGVQDFTFANITLDASAGGEDVKVTSLVVADATGSAALPGDLINWELWGDPDSSDSNDAIVQIVTTNSTASATYSANTVGIDSTVTFTMKSPIHVSKNKSVKLQVRADVISSAATTSTALLATYAHVIDLSTVTASGWSTGSTVSSTPAGAGQAQTVLATGALKVERAADSAVAGPIVAGSKGVALVKYKLTASYENIDVTTIPFYLATEAAEAGNLQNVAAFKLYLNGTLIGNAAGYGFTNAAVKSVELDTGVLRLVKDTPTYLEIKADFNDKTEVDSGTAARIGIGDSDGDASTWSAAGNYNITANGKDSGSSITLANIDDVGDGTGSVYGGNIMGVYDGVLTMGPDASGPSGVQTAGTNKEVLRFWLTATGDEITVYDLELLTSGSATDGSTNASTGGVISGASNAYLYNTDRSVTYATWTTAEIDDTVLSSTDEPLDAGATGIHVHAGENALNAAGWDTTLVIGAGQTKTLMLVGDTTGAGGASTSKSFQAQITGAGATASGVQWYDVELQGDNGTCDNTTTLVDLATGAECVVDSATYTKTLPVSGNGLTYN
ncbi:MAG: hypothetical protein ABIG71_01340 [Candidatus Uhrbacteria bacterium]